MYVGITHVEGDRHSEFLLLIKVEKNVLQILGKKIFSIEIKSKTLHYSKTKV